MKMSDIKEASEACEHVEISEATRHRLDNQEECLKSIQGIDIKFCIKFTPEQWTKILEQVCFEATKNSGG